MLRGPMTDPASPPLPTPFPLGLTVAAAQWTLALSWTVYVVFVRPDPETLAGRWGEPAWLPIVLGVALVVTSGVALVAVSSEELPDQATSDAIGSIVDPTTAAVQGNGPVLVDFVGSAFGEYQAALVAAQAHCSSS